MELRGESGAVYDCDVHAWPDGRAGLGRPGVFVFARADDASAEPDVRFVGMTGDLAEALAAPGVRALAALVEATQLLVHPVEARSARRAARDDLVARHRPPVNVHPPREATLTGREATAYRWGEGLPLPSGAGVFALTTVAGGDGPRTHRLQYVGMTQDVAAALESPEVEAAARRVRATHVLLAEESDHDARAGLKTDVIATFDPPLNRPRRTSEPVRPMAPPRASARGPAASVPPVPSTRQCGVCHGDGSVTCGSCGGRGGRQETRVDYDWEGTPTYLPEWVSCGSCSGGYVRCGACGGRGHVYG